MDFIVSIEAESALFFIMANKFVHFCRKGNENSNKVEKIYLQKFDSKKNKLVNARQVIWGDYLRINENFDTSIYGNDILAVTWSPNKEPTTYFIHKDYTTELRPMEIIFLDVGQGDGAILITPERGREGKVMVIDAGEKNNMNVFLKARFAPYHSFNFHCAVITHPDMDHYLGFEHIFGNHRLGFEKIYQNGLVERPVGGTFEKVGGAIKDSDDKKHYMYELAQDRNEIENLFSDDSTFGRYVFPNIMFNALNNPNILDFPMLSTHANHSTHENGRSYMPDFAPSDGRDYSIEVLGPIAQEDQNGKLRLERFSSNYGKTKNGHSIILRLHYGKYKVLFGGDLNVPAEKYLLKHYTNRNKFPRKESQDSNDMIAEARNWFGADIMKVCHHGADDVTDEFMSAVNPACFVISSGDQEGHVHPRPDLLGRLGKFGKGESPVLLSTELQRSTREFESKAKVKELLKKITKIKNEAKKENRETLKELIDEGIKDLARNNVDTYGAIYMKTDGKRMITAFKIEELSDKKKWFYFQYDKDDVTGEITLV